MGCLVCFIYGASIFVHQAILTTFEPGDRVSFEAKHLSGEFKASFMRQYNVNGIDSLEVQRKS
jgi:hypothetical protein